MNKMPVVAIALLLGSLIARSEVIGVVGVALGAAWLLSVSWLRLVERGLRVRREVPAKLSHGEEASADILIRNTSVLRAPWLEIRESVPLSLRLVVPEPAVVSLGAGQSRTLSYRIRANRRGWHRVGPLQVVLGDVLGLRKLRLNVPPVYVTVYPRVLPVARLGIPAALSYGPLAGRRGEDPARPAGVRQYYPGDDIRRLDWKSSARQSALLVRRADATIAPETTIALAFGKHDYPASSLQDALERAAIVAASLAVELLGRKLPVSFVSNGYDPKSERSGLSIGFGKGDAQRGTLLSALGRVASSEDCDLFAILGQQPLPWGATIALVMADLSFGELPQLDALRRRGQQLMLVLVEGSEQGIALARQQHLRAYSVDPKGLLLTAGGG